jgi:hypothetical protein
MHCTCCSCCQLSGIRCGFYIHRAGQNRCSQQGYLIILGVAWCLFTALVNPTRFIPTPVSPRVWGWLLSLALCRGCCQRSRVGQDPRAVMERLAKHHVLWLKVGVDDTELPAAHTHHASIQLCNYRRRS